MKRFLFVCLFAGALPVAAEIKLPALISDNMVLQQAMPVRIWGSGAAGEAVTVSMNGQAAKGKADSHGNWEVFLSPMRAGGPFDMSIAGANTLSVKNVLIGEVWVASGQSNMAFALRAATGADQEIAAAANPQIRFFQVKTTSVPRPVEDVIGTWKLTTPENAPGFSAVAYFFAKDLHAARGVPVGILQSAVGGTPAQAWTTHETLVHNPMLTPYLDSWAKLVEALPAANEKYQRDLAKWKIAAAKARAEKKTPTAQPRAPAGSPGHVHTPSGLYNGMIAPLTPYGIRGALWYQGEANAGSDAELYRTLFAEMILDWRRAWGQGQFPFLWVQLAGYDPPGRNWGVIRDSQTRTLELRNTGQALAIDVGEPHDIHPKDKQTVGKRLALVARSAAYGENIVASGPQLRMVTEENGAMRIWFDYVGSGLATRDGASLTGFRVAGSDGRFFKAEAKIDGNTVVVSSSMVGDPSAVRYAWENFPAANLVNKEGLPAVLLSPKAVWRPPCRSGDLPHHG
ncbi:MAG: sialate O-acetylesterase [Candidatus Solibacter usitatus]|nr:sialate O-acetylesterase [Candidatus Solibacter usitatus]